MLGWPIAQLITEFVASPPNRFRMQARDLGKLFDSAMSKTSRLAARHPAALLLVEAAQQQIELPMIVSHRMVTRPTCHTATLMNEQFRCHRPDPFPGVAESLHQNIEFTK